MTYPTIKLTSGIIFDAETATNLMDNDIREFLHSNFDHSSEQEFFEHYCEAHQARFNEDFSEILKTS